MPRWKKTCDQRQVIVEGRDIRILRIAYLRAIRKFRQEGRPIVYIDETYLHSSHTTPHGWTDGSLQGLKAPMNKGQRLIIVHAGGENGFIPNALLIFKSGLKTGDYHQDMNSENFARWLEMKLIPNLPPNSVIVLDNASYHNLQVNRPPTINSRKDVIQEWLNSNGIHYPEGALKIELLEIVKQNKPKDKNYTVDNILKQHGHVALRLPPYHPELNPIEKIWATVKNWVGERNVTFKLDDVRRLAEEKFSSITKEEWLSVCNRIKQVEANYIEREHVIDSVVENFVINIGQSDSDQTSDSEEEEEEEEEEEKYEDGISGVLPLPSDSD